MLMVGLGGASLVNSAGNELLSYDNPDKTRFIEIIQMSL